MVEINFPIDLSLVQRTQLLCSGCDNLQKDDNSCGIDYGWQEKALSVGRCDLARVNKVPGTMTLRSFIPLFKLVKPVGPNRLSRIDEL